MRKNQKWTASFGVETRRRGGEGGSQEGDGLVSASYSAWRRNLPADLSRSGGDGGVF